MRSTKREIWSFFAALSFCAAPLHGQLEDMTLDFSNVTSSRINQTVAEDNLGNEKEVEFGDYDNDGDYDVVIAVGESDFGQRRNKLYRNDSGVLNEVSGTSVIPGFANTDTSRSAYFRDYDNDGDQDLIIINDSNSGAGSNNAPGKTKYFRNDNGVFVNVSQNLGNQTGAACNGVSEDFDGNGAYDLVMCNYPNISQDSMTLNGINGNPDGIFTVVTNTNYPNEGLYGVHAEAGDMNGDGQIDILMANWENSSSFIYYNNNNNAGSGQGDFRYGGTGANTSFAPSGGTGERALVPIDINGDGLLDIYFANRGVGGSRADSILINTGNDGSNRATFNETFAMPSVHNTETHKVTVCDLDNDNKDDIIVMTETRRPRIYRNLSTETDILLVEWTTPNITVALEGWHANSIDLTGNGRSDIFFGSDRNDNLFENVAISTIDENTLAAGILPAFNNQSPIAVSGSVPAGGSKFFVASGLPPFADVSVVLRSTGDVNLTTTTGPTNLGTSARVGDGVPEGMSFQVPGLNPIVFEITNAAKGVSLGDLNGDGVFNLLDVQPFVDLLSDGGFDAAADFNGDGVVNLLDVSLFVDGLAGGSGGKGGEAAPFVIEFLSQN